MSPKGSHWSPEEAKPRVRPQADQSAAPHLHGGERQLRTQGNKKRPWSHGRQGRWFPKQQGSGQNLPGADHLCASPLKAALLASPCCVALEADPTGLDQRGPVCYLLTSPRGNLVSGSLPGAPGTGSEVSRELWEVLSRDSDFSILMAAPYPGPFGPRVGNSSLSSLGFSAPCPYLCKCSKSPTYERVLFRERVRKSGLFIKSSKLSLGSQHNWLYSTVL